MRILTIIAFVYLSSLSDAQSPEFNFVDASATLANLNIHSGAPMAVVDVNGDGLDDIVRLHDTHMLKIDYQKPEGGFTGFSYGNVNGTTSMWSICVADVNEDGLNDFAVGGYFTSIKLFTTLGQGQFTVTDYPNSGSIFLQGSNFVDINND